MTLSVVEVSVEDVYDLRRRVLRPGHPESEIAFEEDDRAGCFHLVVKDPDIVGIATFFPSPTEWAPGTDSWQLRGMAVEPDRQGQGLGRVLIGSAVGLLRAYEADVLWANVRDSAAGFYQRLGWKVVGDGFVTLTGLPHHVALFPLR